MDEGPSITLVTGNRADEAPDARGRQIRLAELLLKCKRRRRKSSDAEGPEGKEKSGHRGGRGRGRERGGKGLVKTCVTAASSLAPRRSC